MTVRPGESTHLPQIQEIFTHYVLNTVVSFLVHAPPLEYVKSRFESSKARGLPYLVCLNEQEEITGYAYASAFRGFMLGYGHSVEISIFVHPKYVGRRVGAMLMEALLQRLGETKHVSCEEGYEDAKEEFEVRSLVAVMSFDTQDVDKTMALREWYVKWGFEEVGRLKGIGFKNGRW